MEKTCSRSEAWIGFKKYKNAESRKRKVSKNDYGYLGGIRKTIVLIRQKQDTIQKIYIFKKQERVLEKIYITAETEHSTGEQDDEEILPKEKPKDRETENSIKQKTRNLTQEAQHPTNRSF